MKINYIFRSKKLNSFSIENVFNIVSDEVAKECDIEKSYVPMPKFSISSFLKNIIFASYLDGDIYHITGSIHYVCAGLPGDKTVLTIHDLRAFERLKDKKLKKFIYEKFFVWYPVKKCKVITAISEKTKDEILKVCPWAASKVVVIPDPLNSLYQYVEKPFNKDCPHLFFLGAADNKNHYRMIEAIKDIKCTIDIVGKIPQEEIELLDKYEINYEAHQGLTDEEIVAMYVKCDIVMFASTYEGFGMPIIEGQKTGRAILTSNISPMKEVSGAGACLVDPYDVDAIKGGLLRIIQDDHYREELIEAGRENAEQFTAENIAKQYLEIYSKIEDDSH